MKKQSLILVDRTEPQITILTLNYPEKRNALSISMMEEFVKVLKETQENPSQRVIILKGAGSVFCTGLDLNEAVNSQIMERSTQMITELFSILYSTPLTVIAAVHGAALAGGAGLMSVCDFIIATEETHFGFPELRRGIVPSLVMTFLRRQLREHDLRELFLFGEVIDASRAMQIGMINRIVSSIDLFPEAIRFAKLSLMGAPVASSDTKRLLNKLYHTSLQQDIATASVYHLQSRCSEEAKEGVRAFLEKREAKWVNSKGVVT